MGEMLERKEDQLLVARPSAEITRPHLAKADSMKTPPRLRGRYRFLGLRAKIESSTRKQPLPERQAMNSLSVTLDFPFIVPGYQHERFTF
jgi:hypothetical protein